MHEIVLARLEAMRLFFELTTSPHAKMTEDAGKRMWTLLQVAPVYNLGRDYFKQALS